MARDKRPPREKLPSSRKKINSDSTSAGSEHLIERPSSQPTRARYQNQTEQPLSALRRDPDPSAQETYPAHMDVDPAPAHAIPKPESSHGSRDGLHSEQSAATSKEQFPRSYRYEWSFTREGLIAWLDESNLRQLNIPDMGNYLKAHETCLKLQKVMAAGWDKASEIDEGEFPVPKDAELSEGTSRKKAKKQRTTDKQGKRDKNCVLWENFLNSLRDPPFDFSLLRAAATLGYRAAKYASLASRGATDLFFLCEYDAENGFGCDSNQYTRMCARNTVSDFFGRNKTETHAMPHKLLWCRKHYQNAAYKDHIWQLRKRALIDLQLGRLGGAMAREWPGRHLTFTVGLWKKDFERVQEVLMRKGEGRPDPVRDKHPADLNVLLHIHDTFCGPGRDVQTCKQLTMYAQEVLVEAQREFEEAGEVGVPPRYTGFEMVPEYRSILGAGALRELVRRNQAPKMPRKASVKKARTVASGTESEDDSETAETADEEEMAETVARPRFAGGRRRRFVDEQSEDEGEEEG